MDISRRSTIARPRLRNLNAWSLGIVLTIAMLGTVTQSLRAEEMILSLDPAKTEIGFTLAATLHTVKGSADLSSGEIRFDLASGQASGEVVVKAASAGTDNSGRDRNMHRDVLESAKYSRIVFRPQQAVGDLTSGTVTVIGEFELHGSTHRVEWPISVERAGDTVKAEVRFIVPYVEWGLEDPSTFVLRVAKEVEVRIHALGTLRSVPTETRGEDADG